MRRFLLLVAVFAHFFAPAARASAPPAPARPNVIFILADDLGYADLGCYGQKKIRTPRLDRLAAEGLRFTQYYAGNAVCAPSRCVLMTGLHSGHAVVRNNSEVKPEGQHPMPAGTVTIARLLKGHGYVTGAAGKWGLGPPGSTGDPLKQGFDLFFGYNCQRHAHNHYPTYLWRNDRKVEIKGNPGGATGKQHSHDLFEAEALRFIERNKDRPFFLYLPFTIPHVALQVPDDSLAEYKGKWDDPPYKGGKGYLPHPHPRAAYAAMITRMDRSVGRILDLLKKLNLDERTVVFFSSDNGPVHGGVGGSDSAFFASAGPLRGLKGSLYEGGIRVPFLARWPGHIKPGTVSDLPCAAYDVLPTLCELTGARAPKDSDGISLVPTLLGKPGQKKHAFLYWEFPGYGGQQAVRLGDWKGVRQELRKGRTAIQLYNLARDIGERDDVAGRHPDVVRRIERIMADSHRPSAAFPLQTIDKVKKKKK
jgi:arylsulfatase